MVHKLMAVAGLVCVLCAPSAIAAQSGFGIVGGVVSATLSTDDDDGLGSRTGIALGLSMNRAFGGALEFAPELLYVQKGAKYKLSGYEQDLKISYVEIPLLLRKTFEGASARPFLTAGPVVAFKVACKFKESIGGNSDSADCEDLGEIAGFDYGVMIGAGVALQRLSFSVRYDLGLANINSESTVDDANNRALMLLVGFSF